MSAKPREVSSNDAQLDPESEYSSQRQPVQEKRKQQRRQHTKYQCPADFVFCNFRPCASTRLESVNDGNTELWLIKAPVTFSPDSFSGIRVPMMGLETIQPHTGHQAGLQHPQQTRRRGQLSPSDDRWPAARRRALRPCLLWHHPISARATEIAWATRLLWPIPACPRPLSSRRGSNSGSSPLGAEPHPARGPKYESSRRTSTQIAPRQPSV
ncbi:hypothetical protein SKAU_G00093240 [Synaphobranchus kaupii]|uniref:Uncharacterized protein n=1 Tax=Synaphobranchus kaupii TaxID=118154 RepID=A0A9Q1FX48_SYNKA|nr:hypothetical protein SKAU_G00093240 [Synaphobranchus kaupii]